MAADATTLSVPFVRIRCFGRDGLAPVWGVALSRVSDQSTIRRRLIVGLSQRNYRATLGIFTGNA